MKKVILALSVLLAIPAFAESPRFGGRVLDVSCGEVDPFVLGDTCVILVEDDALKLTALLADFDAFSEFEASRNPTVPLVGKVGLVDAGCLARLNKEEYRVISANYSWGDSKVVFKRLKDANCFSFTKR